MAEQKLHPDVTNEEEYDGRDFVGEDNRENVEHYVGVDPIYQTYANETEKPFPFTDEELDAAAERGGLDLDKEAEAREAREAAEADSEDKSSEEPKKATTKKVTTSAAAPKAPVPQQRTDK